MAVGIICRRLCSSWERECKKKGSPCTGREIELVSKSLPGDLGESNLSPWTFVLIHFWEKLNVFENWTKAVNLILREKKNAHQPTTHCFAGLQRATDPRLEALSRDVGLCCCPQQKDTPGRQKEVPLPPGGRCRSKAEINVSIHSSNQHVPSRFLHRARH